MDNELDLLIDMAIELELIVAELYLLYYDIFPEDANFWWQLAMEEKNHASLIESSRMIVGVFSDFPEDLFVKQVEVLKKTNAELKKIIKEYRDMPPTRKDAFLSAYEIEQSAAELHYQELMQREFPDEMVTLLQELNRDDKDHAHRILKYMQSNSIT